MKKLMLVFVIIVLIILPNLFIGCRRTPPSPIAAPSAAPPHDAGERSFPERWVSVAELEELMLKDNVVVVDLSENPSQIIPGAILISRGSIMREFEGNTMEIETREVHEALLGANGISNDTTVIAYCDNNSLWGTRLVWQLMAYGHKDARILEGGTRAWIAAGKPVTDRAAAPREPREYVTRMNVGNVRADFRDVMAAVNDPNWVIVDVRTPGEQAAGRIPGAVTFNYPEDFIDINTGIHYPKAYYENLFRNIPRDAKIIVHCSGGSRTAMVYFIFIDIVGWPERVLNYNGLWANWVGAGGPVEN